MLGRLWQLFRGHYGDKSWTSQHPGAEIIEKKRLDHGYRIVARDGDEQRTIITDALGNVILEQP